jgi:peptide-methionine (S)-S-oxide reductase
VRTRCGYAGGVHPDPTYHDLGDHTEVFAIDFDPDVLSYDDLLAEFWAAHRPTRDPYSRQYMAAAFPSAQQLDRALASRDHVARELGTDVATPIVPDARFYLAEDYHQKYYLRHDKLLMAELAAYTPAAFVDSTAAARLNGYAAGQGSRTQLEAELDVLQLSPAAIAHLRGKLGGRRMQCG